MLADHKHNSVMFLLSIENNAIKRVHWIVIQDVRMLVHVHQFWIVKLQWPYHSISQEEGSIHCT